MIGRHRLTVSALTMIMQLVGATVISAFEIPTHRLITDHAVEESILTKGYLEQELALSPTTELQGADGQRFRPSRWVQEGSAREDSFALFSRQPLRFRHHFYDPHFDRGLTVRTTLGRRAFEWALEEAEEITGQDFSWRDARRYFFDALTVGTSSQREAEMARTFRTLGHVIHLIQDMGSPEHTRNDEHAAGSLVERRIDLLRGRFN